MVKLLLHLADCRARCEGWTSCAGSVKALGEGMVRVGDSHAVIWIVHPDRVIVGCTHMNRVVMIIRNEYPIH